MSSRAHTSSPERSCPRCSPSSLVGVGRFAGAHEAVAGALVGHGLVGLDCRVIRRIAERLTAAPAEAGDRYMAIAGGQLRGVIDRGVQVGGTWSGGSDEIALTSPAASVLLRDGAAPLAASSRKRQWT